MKFSLREIGDSENIFVVNGVNSVRSSHMRLTAYAEWKIFPKRVSPTSR